MATVTFEHVTKKYGEVLAVNDLNLGINDGEFMVLVGPSGCGKTTSLRMIAGLEEITGGTLRIGDKVVNDVAPKDRDIAMVFQSYALYPHMTVRDNLAFGLKLRKVPKPEIERRVKEAADTIQLSNLDARLRVQMRGEIHRLHQRLKATMVYVTHDQVEAMTMGTRIAVMSDGLLQQVGTPQELYDNPVNKFVAGFIGSPAMNFATVTASGMGDAATLSGSGMTIPLPPRLRAAADSVHGKTLVAGFRPEHLDIGDASANVASFQAKADVVEYLGNDELLHLSLAGLDLVAVVSSSHVVRPGDMLSLRLPLDKLHLFDSETGDVIRGDAPGAAPAPAAAAAATA
ncbi:MAG: ABC transporter ATP-binding protein [Candidatus Limnocylindrales bacterium]